MLSIGIRYMYIKLNPICFIKNLSFNWKRTLWHYCNSWRNLTYTFNVFTYSFTQSYQWTWESSISIINIPALNQVIMLYNKYLFCWFVQSSVHLYYSCFTETVPPVLNQAVCFGAYAACVTNYIGVNGWIDCN